MRHVKSAFSYHGTKRNMIANIEPLLPNNINVFTELFCGSAVVSFNINANSYFLNDTNEHIYNFFKVCRKDTTLAKLIHLLEFTPYDKTTYEEAHKTIKDKDDVQRAWAWWVINCQSFRSLQNTHAIFIPTTERTTPRVRINQNKIKFLKSDLFKVIMEKTAITNKDANKFLKFLNKKSPELYGLFLYADPPYIDTDMKTYEGTYTTADYKELLDNLASCPHPFMLSCFETDMSKTYAYTYNWHKYSFVKNNSMKKQKEEVLYMNYIPSIKLQNSLYNG